MLYPTSIKIAIWIFNVCVEILYLPIIFLRLFKKSRKCPPIKDEILLLTARDLAKCIRKKEISSYAVITAYISRINEVNPIINAVLENRFQEALEDARKADNFIQNTEFDEQQIEEKYPLLGVPITVKGSIAVAGMNLSAGRPDRLLKTELDAVAVKYAKDAGAIPILTSNVPELCLNWETTNKLIGTTRNPYDSRRTAGGSSGGEASLIASGASILGIGSDIAGSLRLPAQYCGIWGHKPSPHTVSCIGHYPGCKNKDDWYDVFILGPMARYVDDLKLLLSIIAEPSKRNVLNLNKKVKVENLKFYYMEHTDSHISHRTESNAIQAIQQVINHFGIIAHNKCNKVNIPLMKYCAELSYLRLLFIDDVENLFEGKGEGVYAELFQFLGCNSVHELTSIGYGLLRRNIDHFPEKTINYVKQHLNDLRNDLLKILGDDGVLIFPSSMGEAPYHGDTLRKLFDYGQLSIFNALGFPSTNCPVSVTKTGLPIGIQVVAAPNMDRLTLSVAEEIEKTFGGWKHKYFI